MMRVVRWILIVIGSLVGLVLLATGIGALLPAEHTARAALRLDQGRDSVWAVVRNVEGYPSWWPYLKAARVETGEEGRTLYVVLDRQGQEIPYEVMTSEPPRRLRLRIASEELPFGGTWTYEVESTEGGSVVTITEEGVVHNPLFRFMARFVFGHHATLESYLTALAEHFGEEPDLSRLET